MPPDLATRVLTALKRDPDLMWEVAQGAFCVLGPWERVTDEDGVFWDRAFPNRVTAIRISEGLDEDGLTTYWWTRMDFYGESTVMGSDFSDFEEAARDAEARVGALGFILIPSVPQR